MRLPTLPGHIFPKAYTALHTVQAIFVPVIMGVCAASMVQDNKAHSSSRYMFALAWLTIPMLIYVTMTPRFDRTKPLSNPYAICGWNVMYCFLWFVAPIALGNYNSRAQQQGFDKLIADKKEPKPEKPSCETTISGVPKECSLNNSAVALGVIMFLLLLVTALLSTYVALYYRVHYITPWEAPALGEAVMGATKDAFETGPRGGNADADYALVGDDTEAGPYGRHDGSDQGGYPYNASQYGQGAGTGAYTGAGAYQAGGPGDYDEEYERTQARMAGAEGRSRSVGSGSYDQGRVGFPEGDYSYTSAGGR